MAAGLPRLTQIRRWRRYQAVDLAREGSWFLEAAGQAEAARLDSDRAFEEIYVVTWPRLCRYAWALVRHQEDAEDVAAEAVRRAYAAWREGRGPAGDPTPWLFLIARRIVIDRSKRRVHPWLPLSASAAASAAGASAADPIDRVEAAVWFGQLRACLSARQYEAIVLRYVFDLDDSQIGQVMGLSAAGVRTNVSRGVAALRKRPEVFER
jgi:RNA polymerase sigma factor (sigma-70 family)